MSEEDIDFSKLKVAELKVELKKRGLSVEGKKNELLERLQLNIGDSALLDDTHDDLLDDDVLSEDDVLNDAPIDTPPESKSTQKRPSDTIEDDSKRHPKKIILNRKIVAEAILPEVKEVETPEASEPTEEKPTSPSEGKTIKVSALSEKERLERRAARFGGQTTTAITTKDSLEKTATKISPAPSADLALLKKRAERFGQVAPILEKAELEERKKKRLERFGSAAGGKAVAVGGTIALANSNGSSIDKKAQRAERFKASS